MRSLLLLLSIWFSGTIASADPVLRVVNEEGQPVERFEVMIHTASQGYDRWAAKRDGEFDLTYSSKSYAKASAIDVIIRAEGYASVLQSFQGKAKDSLQSEGAEIKLTRGREVRLKLLPPAGDALPENLNPEFYFAELSWRVEMMWQPSNASIEKSDFNMLNAKAVKGTAGEYQFRVASEQKPFYVGINQPGWIQFFRAGPFTITDFARDRMDVKIPPSGTIETKLVWGDADSATLPFKGVQYELMREIQPNSGSYRSIATGERALDDTSFRVDGLGPGHYMLTLVTTPKNESKPDDRAPNPGRFIERKVFDFTEGKTFSTESTYTPFNPTAYQGDRTVRLKVVGTKTIHAAGKELEVLYFDGHYGSQTAFKGEVPPDGIVTLVGITDHTPEYCPFGPYTAKVNGESVGFFRVQPEAEPQEFTLQLVPQAGDDAPDIKVVDIESNQPLRLSDFRGKLVFLEFWETGCGPCQPAMEKLNELIGAHREAWNDDLAVIPVSLDGEQTIAASHVKKQGWLQLRHYWSEHTGGAYFADAALEFVVHGVPTALLIGRDGKIIWRGHPAGFDLAAEVEKHAKD
jgi:thiol-disulfide isomerase/thioredoxin